MGLETKKASKQKLSSRELILNANPNTIQPAKDRTIVMQMVEGSTSTIAHFIPEPHHTVQDLRREAIRYLHLHIGSNWGSDIAQTLASSSLVFTAQDPTSRSSNFPQDKDRLTSIDPASIIYARITTVRRDNYDIGPASQGDPVSLTSPLLDKVHQVTNAAPTYPALQQPQPTASSSDGQLTNFTQQLNDLRKVVDALVLDKKAQGKKQSEQDQKLEVTRKTLDGTTQELAKTKKALAETMKTLDGTTQELAKTKKALAETMKTLDGTTQELAKMKKALADTTATKDKEIRDLRGQLLELADSQELIHGWISVKYPEYLDAIRSRHLLDCGQAKLALAAGVPTDGFRALSLAWRSALDSVGNDLGRRQQYARDLFRNKSNLDDLTTKVISTPALFDIFITSNSLIRTAGNNAAHPPRFTEASIVSLVSQGVPQELLNDFKQFCLAGQGLTLSAVYVEH